MLINQLKTRRFWLAGIAPAVIAVFQIYLAAVLAQSYGFSLFVLTPLILGFISAVIYRPTTIREFGNCLLANLFSILLIGFLIMAFAIEGLVCLVMAMPLAIPLDVIGVLAGYAIIAAIRKPQALTIISVVFFASMPLLLGFESFHKSKPVVHEVVSTVEIDAPIQDVWTNVIAFPRIEKEPVGVLRMGFAYPIDARINGSAVGAVRYCNFNTGPFVEPITIWQEPNILAFDVKEQPAPMIETGLYENLHPSHLDYLRSLRGQFRLFERDGKTILEGTTFYTHNIAPDYYWKFFSDEIIHQIHMRVLDHIKEVSER